MHEVLMYFSSETREKLNRYNLKNIEEIRIRNNRPIFLKIGQEEVITDIISNTEQILELLQRICDNSIYTYQNQICNGYITVKGGHRVGITGNVVVKDGQVSNISHIYSLNFRISREILNCSEEIIKYILTKNNSIYNTIIISPPGRGKTTILRDLTRKISNGLKEREYKGIDVGVVDERGEIAAMYKGSPQNDIGQRTDVLDNIPKSIGMKMMIRTMNPKVIIADEIGTKEDVEAIKYAVCSGVKGIFTAHGDSLKDLELNPILNSLFKLNIIERVISIRKDRTFKLEYIKEEIY